MNLNYLLIFIGGGLGSLVRSLVARLLPQSLLGVFPLQILCINVIGCLLMGVLAGLTVEKWNPNGLTKIFLTTGFLGGFTTFSAFSLDFGMLVEKKLYLLASLYALGTVGLSLLSFFIGMRAFR